MNDGRRSRNEESCTTADHGFALRPALIALRHALWPSSTSPTRCSGPWPIGVGAVASHCTSWPTALVAHLGRGLHDPRAGRAYPQPAAVRRPGQQHPASGRCSCSWAGCRYRAGSRTSGGTCCGAGRGTRPCRWPGRRSNFALFALLVAARCTRGSGGCHPWPTSSGDWTATPSSSWRPCRRCSCSPCAFNLIPATAAGRVRGHQPDPGPRGPDLPQDALQASPRAAHDRHAVRVHGRPGGCPRGLFQADIQTYED